MYETVRPAMNVLKLPEASWTEVRSAYNILLHEKARTDDRYDLNECDGGKEYLVAVTLGNGLESNSSSQSADVDDCVS
jgi:hypothetical protein